MLEFSFILKKIITFFIEPYGVFLSLLIFGIYFLYKQKVNYAKNIFISLFGLMILLAYPPFSNLLIMGLENKYSTYINASNIKYIHVLGSGHTVDSSQPISSLLSNAGIKRVAEGVIIHKRVSGSILIFTGYKNKTNMSNALINTKLAIALGVNRKDIIINELVKDTKEEAMFTKSILDNKQFILVTSAIHMLRSIKIFKEIGLNPIPAPTDFHKNEVSTYLQFPTINALQESQIAIHEYIGIVWNRVKQFKKREK